MCYNLKNIWIGEIKPCFSDSGRKIGIEMYYLHDLIYILYKILKRCKNATFREPLHFYNFKRFNNETPDEFFHRISYCTVNLGN